MYTTSDAGAKPSTRSELVRQDPGLGMLAARLLFAVQDELYRRLEDAGYRDLLPRHGIVIAYLDERGSRATELAALSGRHKQRVGRVVDELEALGYVTRTPDPADRRAKLVVPTPRGRAVMRLSDEVMDDIGRRGAQAVGADAYGQFRRTLQRLVDELRDERPPATPAART
ncbi:MAG TPA: MarR family winged helix-turn-helix transcriptional regulator [Actinomycetes bacterium]|nr:MarR family winged helix-turn-helix transcriptional regulator [Actinomycetes bacterium]